MWMQEPINISLRLIQAVLVHLYMCSGLDLFSMVQNYVRGFSWQAQFGVPHSEVQSHLFLFSQCSSMLTSCNVNPRHILLIAQIIYYYTSHPSWYVQLFFLLKHRCELKKQIKVELDLDPVSYSHAIKLVSLHQSMGTEGGS